MAEHKSLGQYAYEAYLDCGEGSCLITGLPLVEWKAQDPGIQKNWEHIAQIVRTHVLQDQRLESFRNAPPKT